LSLLSYSTILYLEDRAETLMAFNTSGALQGTIDQTEVQGTSAFASLNEALSEGGGAQLDLVPATDVLSSKGGID